MLLLSMTLASCAGIGDGALNNSRYSDTDDKTEDARSLSLDDIAAISGVIELDRVFSITTDMNCTFGMSSLNKELSFEGEAAYSLFTEVFHSRREVVTGEVDKNFDYIDVDFCSGIDLKHGKFRVYSNDYVEQIEHGFSTLVSSSILSGYTEGIYQNILTLASENIKPDSGVMITIAPEPQDHILSVDDAAEVYKLLLTSERLTHEKKVNPSPSMETIQIFFKTDYGMAVFYVNKDNAVGYYEGFLEGENHRFYKIDGIYEKLRGYLN